MDKKVLKEKLALLQSQLQKLETVGREDIRLKRIASDMGDDYRENEAAKQTMLEHNILQSRITELKLEILELKRILSKVS